MLVGMQRVGGAYLPSACEQCEHLHAVLGLPGLRPHMHFAHACMHSHLQHDCFAYMC